MGRVTVAAYAVSLAGCAQIFGIDNTSGPADAALPPGGSLTIERLSIGASLERNPQNLAARSASYYVEDAVDTSGLRRIPATATGNVFSAELPDGVAASVEFLVDDAAPYKQLIAFPNRGIKVFRSAYEHPSPELAPGNGGFEVSLTLPDGYVTGQLLRLYAVGPWSYHDLSGAELPAIDVGATAVGPFTVAYDTAQFLSIVGPRPLQKVTSADRVVALRYVGGDLTAAGDVASFDQTGGIDAIAATLVEVTRAPLDLMVNAPANVARLGMTTPTSTSGTSLGWYVTAAPGWELALGAGVQLTAGVASESATMVTPSFGNPFEAYDWQTIFVWNPTRTRSFTPPSLALPVSLAAGVLHVLRPTAGAMIDVQAGLPVLVSVNDQPLTSDGLNITIDPNKSVKLTMVADRTANTFYQYNIHELVPNGAMPATALDLKLVYVAQSPTTDIRIPAGVLATGKVYSVRAFCVQGGFPGLPMGDFTDRDLPLTLGYFDSGVFTVAAP